MSAEISAFLTSSSALADIIKTVVSARDSGISAAIKADLTERLLQSQSQTSQILGAVIEKDGLIQTLTQRVRELETAQSEKARYRLAKLGTVGDFFAYQLRPATELVERSDEPAHFLCQPCFDAGKKSILRLVNQCATCSLCKLSVRIEPGAKIAPRAVVNPGFNRNW